jgi:pilus assembly protein Flp/PilA
LRKRAFRAPPRRIDGNGLSPSRRFLRFYCEEFLRGATKFLGKDQVVRTLLWSFLAGEQAAAAIEYGLLAAGIAVAIIAVVAALGTNLNTTFSTVSTSLK